MRRGSNFRSSMLSLCVAVGIRGKDLWYGQFESNAFQYPVKLVLIHLGLSE